MLNFQNSSSTFRTTYNQIGLPRIGLIMDSRGEQYFASVNKLWKQTVEILSGLFPTSLYMVDGRDVLCQNKEYIDFVSKVDLLFLLSPRYHLDRTIKDVPAIIYGVGSLQKGGYWLLDNRDSFRVCDSLILNSSGCEAIFKALVGDSAMQSYLMPLPVNTQIFYPRSEAERFELRRKYRIPTTPFIMMYSGRIDLQKNCHLLLSILREIRLQHDVHLVLVGAFDNFYVKEFSQKDSPDIKTAFEQLIDQFGLNAHVTLVEHQISQVALAEIMATADVGINLSTLISENFGYTQIEMQATGLPVICADWGGLHDTVIHGKTGFRLTTILSNWGVRVDFESAIQHLDELIIKPDLRKTFGFNARRHALSFDLAYFSQSLSKVVEDTLSRATHRANVNDFKYHPLVTQLHTKLANIYGSEGVTFLKHQLHPMLDMEHYRFILSKCVTSQDLELQWLSESDYVGHQGLEEKYLNQDLNSFARLVVHKAFDWTMLDINTFVSYDPRWNLDFELIGFSLTADEKELLWQIEYESRLVSDLVRFKKEWSVQEVLSILQNLTVKGLIL